MSDVIKFRVRLWGFGNGGPPKQIAEILAFKGQGHPGCGDKFDLTQSWLIKPANGQMVEAYILEGSIGKCLDPRRYLEPAANLASLLLRLGARATSFDILNIEGSDEQTVMDFYAEFMAKAAEAARSARMGSGTQQPNGRLSSGERPYQARVSLNHFSGVPYLT